MSRKHHELKTETEYYQAVEKNVKKFEIRKNDRDYKKYDMIKLVETVAGKKTGRVLGPFEIKYIFHGGLYGLDKDYCVINW